jgi:RNA polymerase sigma factor (sigma-70 family)
MVESDKRSDGELLAAVASRAAQDCFAELVRRHAPMVLSACHRQLGDRHDAEDAAQAVFLVLWQKAATLRRRSSVAGWLHHVARNICHNARRAKNVRMKHEREAASKTSSQGNQHQADWDRIKDLLDGELDALPEKYRVPIVLFHLEGRSLEETAALLRLKASTLTTRLNRGREMLRKRLARRGITISAAALAGMSMTNVTTAAMPLFFAETTAKAANLYGLGETTAGGLVSARTLALTKGALDMFTIAKIRIAVSVMVATVLILSTGSFLMWQPGESQTQAQGQKKEITADKAKEPAGGNVVNGLRLTLSADRSETFMKADGSDAEPVKLKLTFTNVSDKPIKLNAHAMLYRLLFDAKEPEPGSLKILFGELDIEFQPPVAKDFPVLAPGKSWSPIWTHSFPGDIAHKGGFTFCEIRKSGVYKLRYTYENQKQDNLGLAKGSWTGRLPSNELVLTILPHDAKPDVRELNIEFNFNLFLMEKLPFEGIAHLKGEKEIRRWFTEEKVARLKPIVDLKREEVVIVGHAKGEGRFLKYVVLKDGANTVVHFFTTKPKEPRADVNVIRYFVVPHDAKVQFSSTPPGIGNNAQAQSDEPQAADPQKLQKRINELEAEVASLRNLVAALRQLMQLEPMNSPPEVPKLLQPAPGSELDNGRIDVEDSKVTWDFRWTPVQGADSYQLQIFSPDAEQPWLNKVINDVKYQHVQAGTYAHRYRWQWRVQAVKGGKGLGWSEFRNFDVKPIGGFDTIIRDYKEIVIPQ